MRKKSYKYENDEKGKFAKPETKNTFFICEKT